jgi:hypothetical protein
MLIALLIGLAASCLAVFSVVSVLRQERKLDSRSATLNVQELQRQSSRSAFVPVSDLVPTYSVRDQERMQGPLNPGSQLLETQEWTDPIEVEQGFEFQTSLIQGIEHSNKDFANGGKPHGLIGTGFLKQAPAA